MTGNLGEAFLRQLPSMGQQERRYQLFTTQEAAIGRESNCQIFLDGNYSMVSRRHAVVRPLPATSGYNRWELCDLGSANGTYVNAQRLVGCQELHSGDRIQLGNNGPAFIFEGGYQSTQVSSPSAPELSPTVGRGFNSPPPFPQNNDRVSFTQLFPIASTRRDLISKGFLIPGAVTVLFVVLLLTSIGRPVLFNLLLGTYLAVGALYFIYRLCGKYKPWWTLLLSALTTVLILFSPILNIFIFVFRGILPGNVSALSQSASFPVLLITYFFGAGLLEELLKALPIFGALWLGRLFPPPSQSRIGVTEPLDGILLGSASAVGFTLVETLGQYVPKVAASVASMQAGEAGQYAGQLAGLELLIPRILGEIAGHMAYSGYFGYFIGLSVLKPRQRWSILAIGYLTAAALHAFWDATASLSIYFLVLVGIASYAFLTAAVLKARTLSPTRSQNFATRFIGPP